MTAPLGALQRQALEQLAAAPGGLTTKDLGGSLPVAGNRLASLADRGLARVAGKRAARTKHLKVWVITRAGRELIGGAP